MLPLPLIKKKIQTDKLVLLWPILLAAGSIYLFYGLSREGLWFDEAYSVLITKHSIADMIKYIGDSDAHPPLYYLMLKAFTCFFGRSVFSVRAFSLLGVLALAALGMGPVRQIFGTKTGVLYTFVVLITPSSLFMAHEARMYSWAAVFVTGSALYAYLAAYGDKKHHWVMFGTFSILAMYTHYYALLAIAIIDVILFIYLILNKSVKRGFLLANLVMAALYIPWTKCLLNQMSAVNRESWNPEINAKLVFRIFSYLYNDKFTMFDIPYITAAAFVLVTVFIAWGIWQGLKERHKPIKMVLLSVIVFISTIMTGVIVSLLVTPVIVERYSLTVVGLFLLPAAYSLSKVSKRNIALACILFVLPLIPQASKMERYEFNGPINEVNFYLSSQITSDSVFLHTNIHTLGVLAYYFPDNKHFLFDVGFSENTRDYLYGTDVTRGQDIDSFIRENADIWLINRLETPEERISDEWIKSGKLKTVSNIRVFTSDYSWFKISAVKVVSGEQYKEVPDQHAIQESPG